MTQAARARDELPKLVGYREIFERFGLTRRQLERMQRDGRFPLAMRLTGENGNKRAWPLEQVLAWYDEQRAGLVKLAVTNPSAIKDDQVPDALQALGARLASLHGQEIATDDVVGITYKLTDEQRAAIAHNAAAEQRELIEGILERLDGLHIIEALILQRAYLAPLRTLAEDCLRQFGVEISMTDDEWSEAGWLIVDRIVNGKTIASSVHPREVVEALADDGVLSRKSDAA